MMSPTDVKQMEALGLAISFLAWKPETIQSGREIPEEQILKGTEAGLGNPLVRFSNWLESQRVG